MLSEEEMRAIDFLKGVCTDDCVNKEFVVKPILYLIEKQQKELNNLKEIEKSHQEENGKLRVEFEKVYEDNLTLVKELEQEKEKNEELEKHQKQYLDGELITAKQGKFSEKMIKENYIRKDKLKAIQGELCMRLGSYVRDEASPEQERIAGGINIINKILKGE